MNATHAKAVGHSQRGLVGVSNVWNVCKAAMDGSSVPHQAPLRVSRRLRRRYFVHDSKDICRTPH